jgi:hypothetical protein
MSREDLKLLAQALKESKDRDHYAVVDRRVLKQAVRELGDLDRLATMLEEGCKEAGKPSSSSVPSKGERSESFARLK